MLYGKTLLMVSSLKEKVILGFHVGVFGTYNVANKLNLITELHYVQKGFKSDDLKITYHYVELPLMVSYGLNDQLSIEVGGAISHRFSVQDNGNTTNSYDEYNLDFGIIPGLSFTINPNTTLNMRYYYGLKPVDKFYYIESADIYKDPVVIDQYNRNLYFTLAIRLI